MSRLTRDGTAETVSRDQILRHVRGQGNINFPCSVDDEQDWQPYPVDPYSPICDDHTYIHTYIRTCTFSRSTIHDIHEHNTLIYAKQSFEQISRSRGRKHLIHGNSES